MGDERRQGLAVLLLGLALIVWVQGAGRVMPAPLFDGLILSEPYRYLDPPVGGAGSPTRLESTRTIPARPRGRRLVFGYTREYPPQAQWFAVRRDIAFPTRARTFTMVIEPVEPPGAPETGYLVGNAYRFALTDERGRPIRPRPTKRFTIAIRAPVAVDPATIAVFRDGRWQPLKTSFSGLPDTYLADVTSFGTFAIVSPNPDPLCFGSAFATLDPSLPRDSPRTDAGGSPPPCPFHESVGPSIPGGSPSSGPGSSPTTIGTPAATAGAPSSALPTAAAGTASAAPRPSRLAPPGAAPDVQGDRPPDVFLLAVVGGGTLVALVAGSVALRHRRRTS
jgi:hypothetical protein